MIEGTTPKTAFERMLTDAQAKAAREGPHHRTESRGRGGSRNDRKRTEPRELDRRLARVEDHQGGMHGDGDITIAGRKVALRGHSTTSTTTIQAAVIQAGFAFTVSLYAASELEAL